MPADLPVYGHIGLFVMSLLMYQFARAEEKSRLPVIQLGRSFRKPLPSSLRHVNNKSLLSSAHILQAMVSCFVLLRQEIPCDLVLALPSTGKSIAAKIAMIAITTSSSIKVKPPVQLR